jgi:F-type H+-transporting ATPase subunit b
MTLFLVCLTFGAWSLGATPLLAAKAPTAEVEQAEGHAGEEHDHIGHANATKDIDDVTEIKSNLAVWSFVVFVILFAILYKFAWGPISDALDKREKNIADNIAASERAAADAQRVMAEYDAKLAAAADQVRAMLDDARRDAEHTKEQIVAEAKAAAHAENERQMREVRTATDQALRSLAEASANMAVDLAGKIIRQKLSPQDHERLVREAVDNFRKSPSLN